MLPYLLEIGEYGTDRSDISMQIRSEISSPRAVDTLLVSVKAYNHGDPYFTVPIVIYRR